MSMVIGFDYGDCTSGSIKRRFTRFAWEIRYAWQRAWRGYDDVDVFCMAHRLPARIAVLLKEFRKYNDSTFTDKEPPGRELSKDETNSIVDDMIFYFQNCDDEVVYERLYGKEPWDGYYIGYKWEAMYDEKVRCQKEAMRLLSQWIWELYY